MTCTKISLGDLPELINKIMKYFQNDLSTLHSCILVNRLWCRVTIPLLWENPFSIKILENYHFIDIYLNNLNDDDKVKLIESGININLYSSNTLFNYPSFIKNINTLGISRSITMWAVTVRTKFNSSINLTQLIYKSLFKIFIDNEANLHTFEIEMFTDKDCENFNFIFELILQNSYFISNIKNFKLRTGRRIAKIGSFLSFLSSNCNSISKIHFQFKENNGIEKFLSRIINSQNNLKKILFQFNDFPLYHSLLSLKNSNCSNTLKTIIFYYIDFKRIFILKEVFEQLNVLESIHILYCYSLNSDFIQQIIDITKPFKLRSLFLSEIFQIELFQLLLQKSGNYLENIRFEPLICNGLKKQLLELIILYNVEINFFELWGFDNQNIFLVFNLIENIKQNLNYLCIDRQLNDDIELSSIVLLNLGQILPSKLEYLNLSLMINENDFEIFLKNSQNTFIKKLLIKNNMKVENFKILSYIENYIVKKKRVKYLAYKENFMKSDLIFLKDQVKNFKFYNVIVQNYDDLNINCYKYIKDMY
ncbi:hypothetical protein C1645_877823 [Glomus cerebriforme]|uniref:F-box domain-containing protein n=1 Tax=Glomus cerebriforme TaxID=658196 RepID=A0A397SP42_9GLOM|nr:hypothetical protein C1645_877823 [Glomus cerebriforme]